jgi:hypothetical protein
MTLYHAFATIATLIFIDLNQIGLLCALLLSTAFYSEETFSLVFCTLLTGQNYNGSLLILKRSGRNEYPHRIIK